jgi:hypothetical protein
METFVEIASLVPPVLGCDLLRRRTRSQPDANLSTDQGELDSPTFTLDRASGALRADYAAMRERQLTNERLSDGPSPELMLFATDVVFTSPSAAASIVSARSASAPLEWKIRPQGLSVPLQYDDHAGGRP